jgi:hypothetical protein
MIGLALNIAEFVIIAFIIVMAVIYLVSGLIWMIPEKSIKYKTKSEKQKVAGQIDEEVYKLSAQ